MARNAKWTVMVLMGADNLQNEKPLAGAADKDLEEMEKAFQDVPQARNVLKIAVQLDQPAASGGPQRFVIDEGGRQDARQKCHSLFQKGQSGTQVLNEFVSWAKQECPADHYMLILWGHAYDLAFNRDLADPGGIDFPDLRGVLQDTNDGNKLDVVAFDSCNVSLLEGAYELRNVADFLVASQFTDPTPGWQYEETLRRILSDNKLAEQDGPKDLGRAIVSQFVRSYDGRESVTMTLLDLARVDAVAEAMRSLAAELTLTIASDRSEREALDRMFERSRVPVGQPSVDLTALCWNLLYFSRSERLRVAAAAVGDLLFRPSTPFIVAHGKSDLLVAMLQGVSIVAPNAVNMARSDLANLRAKYDRLEFARYTDWDKLVFALS